MAGKEQYLTEQHYLNCDKGMMPKKVSITSQNFVKFSGVKAATVADRQEKNNFICLGSTMFAAGAVAGLACCFIPGPGWAMAAIIAAALIIAAGVGVLICKSAAATRLWEPTSVALRAKIEGKQLLLLSSCMVCPSKGGMITASATVWEAWGKQALTNLGHLGNFAFGFLAGRGAGGMVAGAGGATNGVITKEVLGNLAKQGWKKSSVEFLKIFGQTAKEELIQQFNPLKGWKKGSFICNALRGFGLYGAYKQQLDIWLDKDKSILEKAEASAVGLILDIFAAKGMTYTCFPAGTKVHTQWGLANIESLEEGVPVLTYNISTGEKEYKPVLKTIKRTTPRMCILELSNKETLFVTPEHRFFTNGDWIEVGNMQVGDLLQTKENEYLIIEDKIIISNLVDVYNIEVSDNENYYVTEEGILVHNGCNIHDAEDAGGHSIERHGSDLSLEEMEQRVLGEHPTMPQSRTAMRFDSEAIHQDAVDKAFDTFKSDIDNHFANGGDYKEWVFDYGSQVGEGYTNTGTRRNPVASQVTSNKVTIALKPDGAGGYTLDSAYPTYP